MIQITVQSCQKVAFFQKVQFVFQISQSPKKNIPKKLSSKKMGGNFKFQVQDSFFGIFFFGDWEI